MCTWMHILLLEVKIRMWNKKIVSLVITVLVICFLILFIQAQNAINHLQTEVKAKQEILNVYKSF